MEERNMTRADMFHRAFGSWCAKEEAERHARRNRNEVRTLLEILERAVGRACSDLQRRDVNPKSPRFPRVIGSSNRGWGCGSSFRETLVQSYSRSKGSRWARNTSGRMSGFISSISTARTSFARRRNSARSMTGKCSLRAHGNIFSRA